MRAADLKAKKETRGGINLARTEASGEPSHSRLAEIPDFGGTGRLIKSARRASYEVQPNMKVSNMKKRATKLAAARVDAFTSSISVSLREKQRTLNDLLRRLAPFEAELAVLSLRALEKSGGRSLESVINDFDKMRRAVVRVGKEASAAASTADNKRVSEELVVAGEEAVEETLEQESWALDELNRLAIQLRRLPRVEQGEPVLVLVGMPNVGKSSIVTATSTGTPEINNYPFTTRSLKLGHVISPGSRYQLMDTPGVLRREEEERNAMEGLTLASVNLLPSVIIFVMDLSGTSGPQSAPRLQLRVRDDLKAQFPHRPWLDVRSKADLPLEEGVEVPPGTLDVSVHEGTGIEELQQLMTRLAEDEGQRLAEAHRPELAGQEGEVAV